MAAALQFGDAPTVYISGLRRPQRGRKIQSGAVSRSPILESTKTPFQALTDLNIVPSFTSKYVIEQPCSVIKDFIAFPHPLISTIAAHGGGSVPLPSHRRTQSDRVPGPSFSLYLCTRALDQKRSSLLSSLKPCGYSRLRKARSEGPFFYSSEHMNRVTDDLSLSSQKKSLNVDSPSFTPTSLARSTTISSQAANAAPFTPRGIASRTFCHTHWCLITSLVLTEDRRCNTK
jgi:hypothetical protein